MACLLFADQSSSCVSYGNYVIYKLDHALNQIHKLKTVGNRLLIIHMQTKRLEWHNCECNQRYTDANINCTALSPVKSLNFLKLTATLLHLVFFVFPMRTGEDSRFR